MSYLNRLNIIKSITRLTLNNSLSKHHKSLPTFHEINRRHFYNNFILYNVVSFNLSDIGEGIKEVVVKEWFVKEGDKVEQFQNICEVQSDKASVTITSRYDGVVAKLHHKIDEIALVGKPLLDFKVADEETSSSESDIETTKPVAAEVTKSNVDSKSNTDDCFEEVLIANKKVLAAPSVRRIATENKIDLSHVTPSGKLGRILKEDILHYIDSINAPQTDQRKTQEALTSTNASVNPDRVEQLKGIRKSMLKTMTDSLKIPHFGYNDEIDITRLVQLREGLKAKALSIGTKLTYMPFFIKAASFALNEYPILNSSLDLENESIIFKSAHNITIAMETPYGLVVPNIKNCQMKTILEIAKDLNILQDKGLKGKLGPEDFANGTFSLSNIGIVGGTYAHPCILSPQVSIGAIGKTKVLPRFGENGAIVATHIINVSWTADHRVIDGITMAKFSNLWKEYLENPSLFIVR